jgi:hypothetical protein
VTSPAKAQYAAWLRAEREHRGWSRAQMARRLTDAAHIHGDRSVPSLDTMIHNIRRWERGVWPAEPSRLLIRAILGLPPPPAAPASRTTTQATPALINGAEPAPALTVSITIQLPPGTTADITTTQPQP